MNHLTGDSTTAVDTQPSREASDPQWANRRKDMRDNLDASEWLLATALYVMFVILAASTLLT